MLLPSLLFCTLAPLPFAQDEEAPSRALLKELTASPRLAGTVGSSWGARVVQRWLKPLGFEVELDEREVLLAYPRRLEVALFENAGADKPVFERIEVYDPDAIPPGDVPRYNAWARSGEVTAEVVDCGYGLRADFDQLVSNGSRLEGKIALIRYGRSYRGVKVDLASEYGCAGVLLFNDPSEDGPPRGDVWPRGPWKPEWSAQRGSISRMGSAPGDPSTPGFASPGPGERVTRLEGEALDAALPSIPCMPIGSKEAADILERLDGAGGSGLSRLSRKRAVVRMLVEEPRELRTIVNIIATLPGKRTTRVVAGNHRDAWVRGANDAGSGTISLARAAAHIARAAKEEGRFEHTIVLCFWDAEEFGLIGSTEWAEAHASELTRDALLYLNADVAVHGTQLRNFSGTPGLVPMLKRALTRVSSLRLPGKNVWDEWSVGVDRPRVGLAGSGSDYTVFLHHLGIPTLDFGLGGSKSGQYHTAFDDFPLVDRFIDPGFRGHELAGEILASVLLEVARGEEPVLDGRDAARRLAEVARDAGEEVDAAGTSWLGVPRAERLARAFTELADALKDSNRDAGSLYRDLALRDGLPGRRWFKNQLWAPGLETGYSSETFPALRLAARESESALDEALDALVEQVDELRLAHGEERND